MRQAVLVILLVGPVCARLARADDRPKGDRLAKPVQVEADGKPLVRERGGLFPFVGDFYGDGHVALLLGYGGDCLFENARSLVYRNVGKRLEQGTFQFPAATTTGVEIRATDLAMILGGVDLNSAKRRPRYQQPA